MTPQTILFPTDFSGRCDRARDRAVQLARHWGARLILFHVLRDPDPATMADEWEEYETLAHERLRTEIRERDIAFETRLGSGAVAEAILEASDQCAADLVVTGISRHEEIGDFVVGTTVERVIRQSRAPVLVVKERVRQHYARVMVATDFSDCAGLALLTAPAVFPGGRSRLFMPTTSGWRRCEFDGLLRDFAPPGTGSGCQRGLRTDNVKPSR